MNKQFIQKHIEQYKAYLIELAVEECAEFISIVQQSKRFDRTVNNNDICSEIADVIIMMEFMKHIYGEKEVNDEIDRKYNRIIERYYT